MTRYKLPAFTIFCLCATTLLSCGTGGNADSGSDESAASAVTPVTVTQIKTGEIADTLSLSAKSVFLQKNYVKANAIGYLQKVMVVPGQYVQKGQLLFLLKTKEAQSIGNAINVLDTTFKFSGLNRIRASSSGYITQLDHQLGDYVQDADQLAVISDHNSFAFLLQVPYELNKLIASNQNLVLTLPDGTKLNGHITSVMPNVDTLAQTQGLVVKVNSAKPLPENLVAKAKLIKAANAQAAMLPKAAVLANETLTEFWVMKVTNDSTAVKIPVKKGIETGSYIEITSPVFKSSDRILLSGNYGLADTAKIRIAKQ
ncbi:efflux RND transporter periplasmic adaptor subunit [Mucilaginibacter ginkgonis]|uniref:HlyD family efflux transporter periplasmic adaptor subunit n=1 Tax=Mucilaginibacter ginkgonis TaxID=2682091 RepID=A0A6I4I1A1_9SPHI|nr:HlyD family efflux transporter periplasmic adaptor subunit [Mucilaginibacter ginkgonis]QQL48897.1 HlyD family efflux transporter periplasmic adaptor subunit [Mucilaginibacter ginkgonis]